LYVEVVRPAGGEELSMRGRSQAEQHGRRDDEFRSHYIVPHSFGHMPLSAATLTIRVQFKISTIRLVEFVARRGQLAQRS
jgi:hypothetical protein